MSLSVISSPYHKAVHNASFLHIRECWAEMTFADDRIFTINWAFTAQKDFEPWQKKKKKKKYPLWNLKTAVWFGSNFGYTGTIGTRKTATVN